MKVTLAKPPYLISAHPLSSGLFGTFPPIIGHVFTNDELNVNMLKTLTKMETSLQKLPAKVLEPADLTRLHQAVSKTKYVARNQVMCALSLNGGLRACEVSGLTWPMVLGPSGRMKGTIDLGMGITKGGRFRTIPVSDAHMKVMKKLHKEMGKPKTGPVILSERGNAMTPRSVVNWFKSSRDASHWGMTVGRQRKLAKVLLQSDVLVDLPPCALGRVCHRRPAWKAWRRLSRRV